MEEQREDLWMKQDIFVLIFLAGNTPVLREVTLNSHLYKKELNPLGTAKFQPANIDELLRYNSIFYVQYPSNSTTTTVLLLVHRDCKGSFSFLLFFPIRGTGLPSEAWAHLRGNYVANPLKEQKISYLIRELKCEEPKEIPEFT